ncbi:MAG: hypothetical protein ACOH12_11910 [Parvibaculaceae bacterium]
MTNFAAIAPEHLPGRQNMATEAFRALDKTRASGEASKDSFTFADLVDTLNPLQHIPLVSTAYRELTGDPISPQARMAGGALYGGPIGFVASMIDSAVDMVSGNDIGGHLFAGLFGPDKPADPVTTQPVQTAAAITTATQVASPAKAAAPVPVKSSKPPAPMPQMSPETFDALLKSFADPKAAKDANADLAQNMANDVTGSTLGPSEMPPVVSAKTQGDIKAIQAKATANKSAMMQSMTSGLDQLDALKAANAKNLGVQATASQANIGF